MSTQPFRVVVWSTGVDRRPSPSGPSRDRPDLELVGVWVHSADKVGVDAGELAGGDPIGVAATDDVDALLALQPDCVVYAASGPEQDAAAVPDYVRILDAGVNVVTVSSWGLDAPAGVRAARGAAELEAAAATRRRVALRVGDRARLRRRSARRSCSLTHVEHDPLDPVVGVRAATTPIPSTFMMMEVMGFGQPLDHQPLLGAAGRRRLAAWGPPDPPGRRRASACELDEIREKYDRVVDRPHRSKSPAARSRRAPCGAIRIETIGVVDGRDAIVIEHVNRMAADLAPEWPIGDRDGTYRIVIEGDPDDRSARWPLGDPTAGAATGRWSPPRCAS